METAGEEDSATQAGWDQVLERPYKGLQLTGTQKPLKDFEQKCDMVRWVSREFPGSLVVRTLSFHMAGKVSGAVKGGKKKIGIRFQLGQLWKKTWKQRKNLGWDHFKDEKR